MGFDRFGLHFPPGRDVHRRAWVYWLGWSLSRLIFSTYFRWKAAGWEHVPREGPVIFASNHASFADPPLLGAICPRPISYLGRESLFANPVTSWIFRSVGAVPVDRDGASGKGLKTILDRLMGGDGIVLFPEGTRTRDGQFQPARAGVGLVVVKSGAPVVPARVFGTYDAFGKRHRFPRPRPVAVRLGSPLWFHAQIAEASTAPRARVKEIYQEVADDIMKAIQRLERP